MDSNNIVYISNMVLNTITNNMENIMKTKTAIRYSKATKKNALSLFSKGWTTKEIAKKHKTTAVTINNWKNKYPEWVTKTIVTSISKNGTAKVAKTNKPKAKALNIKLTDAELKELGKQARVDIRTVESQAKFYILNGIRNHHGIPF